MGRTTVNLIGNCVATVVIARWENEFDYDKMKMFIKEFEAESSDWSCKNDKICTTETEE